MAFDAIRQDIIDGLTSAQAEAHGWNIEVKAKIAVTDVVRTSNTVVTITLDAEAEYDINADEVITVTVPASAMVLGVPLVATPTFSVYFVRGLRINYPFRDPTYMLPLISKTQIL